jgi:hypothetical protein
MKVGKVAGFAFGICRCGKLAPTIDRLDEGNRSGFEEA